MTFSNTHRQQRPTLVEVVDVEDMIALAEELVALAQVDQEVQPQTLVEKWALEVHQLPKAPQQQPQLLPASALSPPEDQSLHRTKPTQHSQAHQLDSC